MADFSEHEGVADGAIRAPAEVVKPAPDGVPSNEDLLSELQSEGGDAAATGAGPAKAPPAKPAKAPPPKTPAKPVDEDEDVDVDLDEDDDSEEGPDSGDQGEDDEDDLDDDLAEDGPAERAADPDAQRRRDSLRRTEQRQRASLERQRADLDRDRAAFQQQQRERDQRDQRFEALVARLRYDPTSVLRELGAKDDDLEHIAQHVASHSKAAGVTPAHRAAAERAARERELQDRLAKTESEVQRLERERQERDQLAAQDAVVNRLFRRAESAADDTTPFVKAQLAANARRARIEMTDVATRLAKKLERLPTPQQITRAYEKRLARRAQELGLTKPPTGGQPAKPGAAKPTNGAARPNGVKPAPAPASGARTPPPAAPEQPVGIHHPTHAELLAELRAGIPDESET